jgi:hypothetical protein
MGWTALLAPFLLLLCAPPPPPLCAASRAGFGLVAAGGEARAAPWGWPRLGAGSRPGGWSPLASGFAKLPAAAAAAALLQRPPFCSPTPRRSEPPGRYLRPRCLALRHRDCHGGTGAAAGRCGVSAALRGDGRLSPGRHFKRGSAPVKSVYNRDPWPGRPPATPAGWRRPHQAGIIRCVCSSRQRKGAKQAEGRWRVRRVLY